jgi:hypothetical protein
MSQLRVVREGEGGVRNISYQYKNGTCIRHGDARVSL